MATGTVKWFNNAKGYGFVLSEDKAEDLFIHYSSIQMEGYKSLKAGQEVEYDVQEGPKGMHAVNIRAAAGSEPALESEQESAQESEHSGTEDNLHLNPMHGLPKSKPSQPARDETAGATAASSQAESSRETEAAVD